jgi:hypothetical protein
VAAAFPGFASFGEDLATAFPQEALITAFTFTFCKRIKKIWAGVL